MLRATLKSLLARKLRLALSMIAVVLSVMFVAGSFVLTDTLGRSFDALFSDIYTYTDVQVQAVPKVGDQATGADPVPASVVARVKDVSGVKSAEGQVFTNGAVVIGKNGKLVNNQSGQRFGASWEGENELVKLDKGAGPEGDDQVVINKGLAVAGGYQLNDPIDVKTPHGDRKTYRISGIFVYAGGRDSLAGEHTVFFTEKVAQQTMLGETGVFSIVDVKAQSGVALTTVRDNIRTALGSDYDVKTGPELAKESAQPLKDIFKYVNYVLVGFGLVAVLVGIFLILNTFSIIVAQRTQELALLRAMGASQSQMLGSVLLEAVLIGVVGSALGFLAGVGLGALGAYGLASAGGSIKIASLGIPPISAILAFAIGITVTVVAALVPAMKAARVPPIAALREAATPDRPLTKITITGAVVTIGGIVPLVWGLTGAGSATLWLILGGVLGLLIGVALLTPLISRPVVSILGRVFSWSVPGKLGRRNSARNPRRTAITAAAVMIGIALVTAISTVFASLSTSIGKVVDQELQADLVIAGQQTSQIPPTIEPDELAQIKRVSDIDVVAAVTYDQAKVNGKDQFVLAYDDWAAARTVLKLKDDTGSIDSLGSGQLIVDKRTAKDNKLAVGDNVKITLAKTGEQTYKLVGITGETNVGNGFVISMTDAEAGFRQSKPIQAFVKVRDGANVTQVKTAIGDVLKNNPEVDVQTRAEYVGNSTQFFDFILIAVQVLLLVALAISVLGVINTLVLSVIERTRELGMLRAIGLRRSQTMRMITVESVVIVLFGTLLGLVVGGGLGAAIVRALREAVGFGDISLPWTLMAVYFIAALFVGVFAAIIPAIRAARLNVLQAIAYE